VVETKPNVDLVAGLTQAVEASVGDFFGHENARHRVSSLPSPLVRTTILCGM
jgi:hypothetical protein